jgi:hypothetical protein
VTRDFLSNALARRRAGGSGRRPGFGSLPHAASHSESAVLCPPPEAASLSLSHFDGPSLTPTRSRDSESGPVPGPGGSKFGARRARRPDYSSADLITFYMSISHRSLFQILTLNPVGIPTVSKLECQRRRKTVLRNCGAHPDHLHLRDGVPDEIGRQDPGSEDQQPGLVRRQHPHWQEQHGGGGGDGAAAALDSDETGVHQVHTIYA